MTQLNAPFHFDIVGSFLRPEELKEARTKFNNGTITREELTTVEDHLITDLIKKQKQSGLPVITDGEFRRAYWHLDFMWGFNGIEETELEHGYKFHNQVTAPGSILLTGKITGHNHPFVEHFKFVKQFEDENTVARQTIPAPSQLLAELYRENNGDITNKIYPDFEELLQDIGAAYRQVIQDLYNAGCRNVQLDDCTWGMCCDHGYWTSRQKNKDVTIETETAKYLRLNNLALENKPADLVITTHVCRGNYNSTWAASGGYEPIAPILFGKENVDAYYLEFDDERSGDFKPLQEVSDNKKVVLGLITTKKAALENKEAIKARIQEAAQYIPLDRLALSPQCGFASCEIGNQLTEEEQWAKLALVKEIAEDVWGSTKMSEKTIYLGGGCFWGLEGYFKKISGIVSVESGYANGGTASPSYEEVCSGSGHSEVIKVTYNPTLISLDHVIQYFLRVVDPFSINKQGNDVGIQYRSGIYYTDDSDLVIIQKTLHRAEQYETQPFAIEILPLENYYSAEEYHQDYLDKNLNGYCHIDLSKATLPLIDHEHYEKKSDEELQNTLSPLSYAVTQDNSTEKPFTHEYTSEFKPGIYVDITSGEPLFISSQKFESHCGWPSFAKPITEDVIRYYQDDSYGYNRIEVRSRIGNAHLGHVFEDGPAELGGLRYCINGAALTFIPLAEMEDKGYEYLIPLVQNQL